MSVSNCEAQRRARRFPAAREGVGIDCLILRVDPSTVESPKGQQTCITWGRSSAGRAPALQAGGRQFDSVRLHQRQAERQAAATGWPMKRTGHIHGLIAQVVRARA